MPWSFPGIVNPVECVYTQHTGFAPDTASLLCNPQPTNIPTLGTLTLSWASSTISLPQCTIEVGSVRLTTQGRHLQLRLKDRREFWKKAAPISGEYNVARVGVMRPSQIKTLRQLGRILLDALGEFSADVSALSNVIKPAVSWQCESVVEAAQTLFDMYGYSVTLGFGSEPVKVVALGETPPVLDMTNVFSYSDSLDPKICPRYVRTCFEPTLRQLRFKLEAVGREIDGSWVLLDDLSYTPVSGWGATAPFSLPEVDQAEATDLSEAELAESTGYVRRAYRVKGYANGSWTMEGVPSVVELSDVLPLQNRVLDTEDVRPDSSYQPYRIYGKHFKIEEEETAPAEPAGTTTDIGDRVFQRHVWFDGENGIVIFEKPMFYVDKSASSVGEWKPADLWLECVATLRDMTDHSLEHFHYDSEINPQGIGYHTHRDDNRLAVIHTYDSSHAQTGTVSNQSSLQGLAGDQASVIAQTYQTTNGKYIAYSIPKLAARCTGAVLQVQHIFTCGDNKHAVNRTTLSTYYEFDLGVPSRVQRTAHASAMKYHRQSTIRDLSQAKVVTAND